MIVSEPMLYIKWNDQCNSSHPLLDEQHRGLVATINSIHYFIQKGWELKNMTPTLKMLETYVGFHLATELDLLRESDSSDEIEKIYQEYRHSFLNQLHRVTESAIANNEPEELTRYLAKWWMGHQKNFHDKLDATLMDV